MKTIEEMYKEINDSEELQKRLEGVKDKASLEAFLKEHECDATAEEFAEYVKSQQEGEIGDDAAATAAGGWGIYIYGEDEYWEKVREEKTKRFF